MPNFNRAWMALVLAGPAAEHDVRAVRDAVGDDVTVIIADAAEPSIATVRRMVRTGADSVVTYAHADSLPRLTELLRVVRSLASFRRVVVLHDSECGVPAEFADVLVMALRDCPEVRAALGLMAHRSSDAPAIAQQPPSQVLRIPVRRSRAMHRDRSSPSLPQSFLERSRI